MHKMKKCLLLDRKEIDGQNISYHIFGDGNINLVIEMGLGAVAGEWWHIAKYFSDGQANPRKDMYMMTGCTLTLTDDEFKSFLSEINEAATKYMSKSVKEESVPGQISMVSSPVN